MYDRTRELLLKAGLNISEAQMFEKLISGGKLLPLKDIISQCRMTEFTGYRTAKRLVERGLAEVMKRGTLKFIRALSLETIAESVGREQRKLRRLELQLRDLSSLAKADKTHEGSILEVVDGREQFIDLYDSLPERSKDSLLGFGSLGVVYQVTGQDYLSSYEKQWVRRRVRKGVKALLIDAESAMLGLLMKEAKRELRDMRLMNDDTPGADQWTAITGKDAFVFENQFFSPRVIHIRDSGVLRILRDHHKLLWERTERTRNS